MTAIGQKIKEIRKSKNLSQKQVALEMGIDQAQYSRIESGKVEPTISSLTKVAEAMGIKLSDFFSDDAKSYDVNAYDENLIAKLKMLDELDETERKSIFSIIDIAVSRKRLMNMLRGVLDGTISL